ncbi:MAG TPA: hypothetical protein PK252_12455 [Bacteroidales bacterium]|nr:hypothetical protein [Bacteroidales bacterium]
MKNSKILLIALTIGTFQIVSSCRSCNKDVANQEVAVEVDEEIAENINQAKKIFYSLPSPLETAMLIKTAGATYNERLLNPLSNVSNYTTNKSMALNLGVYTTDLSFASLFDQTQTAIDYMQAAKKMADGLGILDAINSNTIQRLEENINNRDVIMDIISETFMASSSFLKENDRTAVASIVLVGGWVEGLYIATSLVNPDNFKNSKLVERIVDQKLSFDIVLKLLDENKDNPDVASLIVEMNELKKSFDKIEIKSSKIEAVKNSSTNVTTLKSETSSNINQAVFKELTDKVKTIRSNFIL